MGDAYEVRVAQDVAEFLDSLDSKSSRIIKENLEQLREPYPGRGQGDKKKIDFGDDAVYRIHIGRTWTAFYDIEEEAQQVLVREILTIDEAHKKYGRK